MIANKTTCRGSIIMWVSQHNLKLRSKTWIRRVRALGLRGLITSRRKRRAWSLICRGWRNRRFSTVSSIFQLPMSSTGRRFRASTRILSWSRRQTWPNNLPTKMLAWLTWILLRRATATLRPVSKRESAMRPCRPWKKAGHPFSTRDAQSIWKDCNKAVLSSLGHKCRRWVPSLTTSIWSPSSMQEQALSVGSRWTSPTLGRWVKKAS